MYKVKITIRKDDELLVQTDYRGKSITQTLCGAIEEVFSSWKSTQDNGRLNLNNFIQNLQIFQRESK